MAFSVAVVADIHGNSFALRAVFAEIQRRGVDCVINLGDTFYGPLDITGTFALLQKFLGRMVSVCGNGDRLLLLPADPQRDNAALLHSRRCLTEPLKEYLSALPASYSDADIFACHGSPQSDTEYLLEEMHVGGGLLRPMAQIEESLAGVGQGVILCGHSHLARTVYLPATSQLVVNPGSVGLPAYADDEPVLHSMESGSPLAEFAVLTRQDKGWRVEHVQVPYDWQAACALAGKNGRPDWAFALATGRAAGR